MPEPGLTELQKSVADLTAVVKSLGTPSDPFYNVARFGAIPDAKPAQGVYQGFLMTAGSNHLDSFNAGFTADDVGKSVVLVNNGGAWPPFAGPGLQNVATITAFIDGNDILLSRAAVADCTGWLIWGTDNVLAFNAAVNAVAASATHAGTITGPPGQYLLTSAPYSNSDGTAYDDGTWGDDSLGAVMCWSGTGFNTACADLPPWQPTSIPIQVALVPGISWFFPPGASLIGTWDGVTVDPVVQGVTQIQPAMFGAPKPSANQEGGLSSCNIDGLNISGGFIGLWNAYNVNLCEIRNCKFNTAIGMLTQSMDLGSSVKNLQFGGYAPWVNGGMWSHREDYPLGQGGLCDPLYINTIFAELIGYNATAAAIDQWFDEVFWRSDFSAQSLDFWEPQKSPLPANQRQTGQPNGGIFPQMANSGPYKGICGGAFVNLTRDNRNAGPLLITNLVLKYGYRPIFYGSLGGGSILINASCEGGTVLANDPYRPSAVQEGAIEFWGANGSEIRNVGWSGSQVMQTLWDLSGERTSGVAGQPQGVVWYNCALSSTVNTQPRWSGLFTQPGSTTPLTQAMMGIVTK